MLIKKKIFYLGGVTTGVTTAASGVTTAAGATTTAGKNYFFSF